MEFSRSATATSLHTMVNGSRLSNGTESGKDHPRMATRHRAMYDPFPSRPKDLRLGFGEGQRGGDTCFWLS